MHYLTARVLVHVIVLRLGGRVQQEGSGKEEEVKKRSGRYQGIAS